MLSWFGSSTAVQASMILRWSLPSPNEIAPGRSYWSFATISQGDLAKAMITEERTFDLTPYRDPMNNVVHLRIQGVDDVLVYRYAP